MKNILIFSFGFLIDLIVGDPQYLYHPVTLIAKFVYFIKKAVRKILPKNKLSEQLGGGIVVLLTLGFTFCTTIFVLKACYSFSFWLGFMVEAFLCNQILAIKCLKDESMKVYAALHESLESAKTAVSRIVGRDTHDLDSEGVIKAAVETIAENTSDG
ncbi:MAG: CobD/CbiB family cobalamin biosynthesis protein, partial [Oscillospiraceae bacterium]